MKFIINSKKIKLTDDLRQYIKDRIGVCDKYIHTDLPLVARVDIERITDHHSKGKVFMATININLKDKLLRAEATREDIYLAINELRDHLKIECRKYKEIIIDKHRKSKYKT
jgi:putative sigma-54 modulation protein